MAMPIEGQGQFDPRMMAQEGMPPDDPRMQQVRQAIPGNSSPIPLAPIPDVADPEPPVIQFKGTNYILTSKVADCNKLINPAIKSRFTELMVMTLRYGIPALEERYKEKGVKVESLDGLKLIQKVHQGEEKPGQGKLKLEYTYTDEKNVKRTVDIDITDELKLIENDQKKICKICTSVLSDTCGGCHTDHDSARKTFITAMKYFNNTKCLALPPTIPYSITTLELISPDNLPESFRSKAKEKKEDKSDAVKDKPASDQKADRETERKATTKEGAPDETVEFPITHGRPHLSVCTNEEQNSPENFRLFPNLEDDDSGALTASDKGKPSTTIKLPCRWVDYLLKGIIRRSPTKEEIQKAGKEQETEEPRSVTPVVITEKEALNYLGRLTTCGSELFEKFNNDNKEKVFIKRLSILLGLATIKVRTPEALAFNLLEIERTLNDELKKREDKEEAKKSPELLNWDPGKGGPIEIAKPKVGLVLKLLKEELDEFIHAEPKN